GVLADRLKWLESVDCLRRRFPDGNPRRPSYHMTRKSVDLYDTALMALAWERRFFREPEMDAIDLVHVLCGEVFHPIMACTHCDREVLASDISFSDGPGARQDLRQKK